MASKLAQLKYCHCTKPPFSFQNARVEMSPVRELGNEVWVCNSCDSIHHSRQIPMHIKRAPRNAVTVLSERGGGNGVHQLTFAMPDGSQQTILSVQPYDRRPPAMGINPNDILLRTWQRLDEFTHWLMFNQDGDPAEMLANKVKARAYAEVLADMMPPFFDNPDDIVREAVQRYKNRENPEYETPGLGVKTLAPYDTMPYTHAASPKKAEPQLDDKTQAGIKKALESGMFTVAQLAKSYSVSEATIESLR